MTAHALFTQGVLHSVSFNVFDTAKTHTLILTETAGGADSTARIGYFVALAFGIASDQPKQQYVAFLFYNDSTQLYLNVYLASC